METTYQRAYKFADVRPHLRPTVEYAPRTGSTTQSLPGLNYLKWCTGHYIPSYCASQTVTLQESGYYLHAYYTPDGLIMCAPAYQNLHVIAPDLAIGVDEPYWGTRMMVAYRWQLLHVGGSGRDDVMSNLSHTGRELLASGDTEELDIPAGATVEDKYGDIWQIDSRQCDSPHGRKSFYFMATRQVIDYYSRRGDGFYSLSYRDIAKLISVPLPA